ncbi:MAG: hypothetical protein P4L55_15190 [Syntrophobacteraceae bacterium]|nr:hypothetical protein [Syntrophobacteraceae bacterium]
MDPVVHFELPYEKRDQMVKFYEWAFGWKTQIPGEEMGNYVIAATTDTGEEGPKTPGAINGGFYEKKAEWPGGVSPRAGCQAPTRPTGCACGQIGRGRVPPPGRIEDGLL